MLHYSGHPVADVLPLMDSVDRQDLQKVVPCFDWVHLWRQFYIAWRKGWVDISQSNGGYLKVVRLLVVHNV